MKTTLVMFWVMANSAAPMNNGSIIIRMGKGSFSRGWGPLGGTFFRTGKRATTRGERLKSTMGWVATAAWFRWTVMMEMVVSPSVMVSEEPRTARVTGSPSMRRPLAELVSTTSTVSPTRMRAWRLEVSGSLRRMSLSRPRPM